MRKRPAFTLIEILVVIMIVAMLAVLAIASYGSTRERAKMDIAADTLVSLLNQQRSLSRSGRSDNSTCYGVYFNKNGRSQVELLQAPYVSVNVEINSTKSNFCDMRQDKLVRQPFDQFEDNKISEISKFGVATDSLAILYRPPEGRILLGNLDNPDNPGSISNPEVTVTFKSANGKEQRSLTLDVSSGLAELVNIVIPVRTLPVIPAANSIIRQPLNSNI